MSGHSELCQYPYVGMLVVSTLHPPGVSRFLFTAFFVTFPHRRYVSAASLRGILIREHFWFVHAPILPGTDSTNFRLLPIGNV